MVDWRALETILNEIDLPTKFVCWIMLVVSTVSYRFNVNGEYSKIMKANRGVRQGSHIPLPVCDYNGISSKSIGDPRLVKIIMDVFNNFTKATGLTLNATKSSIYFGGVEDTIKTQILQKTLFNEGLLPFKYLGIPLTTKRLSITHYMILVDKIMERVKHLSTMLLRYVGRLELLKSITSAIANYWLQCLPLPKFVIKNINTICRTFLWTGGVEPSNISPIA
ncbi:uncharacterized protein LOC131649386 [Vicia villosa]|uniref:uncharacterized protein LOC131649386 n=1 Tax=Vicia villosa TaxID=3911 RepID=UPI00273B0C97|nr:uncharacterized protein LOC131649386 [Vicia villosa]